MATYYDGAKVVKTLDTDIDFENETVKIFAVLNVETVEKQLKESRKIK